MSRGRKRVDPSKKLIKAGFTISPQMYSDLGLLAEFTHSSRSAVLVALVEDYLHDVVEDLKESAAIAKDRPEEGYLGPNIEHFLKRIAVDHHGADGVVYISFPKKLMEDKE